MTDFIRYAGWFSIVVGGIILPIALLNGSVAWIAIGIACVVQGALIVIFGRMAELLESPNRKLEPVYTIAKALEGKYKAEAASQQANESANADEEGFRDEVDGVRYKFNAADNTIIAKTPIGVRTYPNWASFRQATKTKRWS